MYSIEVNNGDLYSFIFTLNITTNNYEFLLPLVYLDEQEYPYNFTVDWGDRTSNTINSFNDQNKYHIYNKGIYTVKIVGDCWGFNNKQYIDSDDYNNKNCWECLTEINNWGILNLYLLDYGFYNATNLSSLPDSEFSVYTIHADNCFENCLSLTDISNNFKFTDTLKSLNYIFSNCNNLKNIPSTLQLPTNIDSAKGIFKNCKKLTNLPNNLFINNTNNIKFLNDFCYNCESLIDIPDDFIMPNHVINSENMFYNCINLQKLPSGFSLSNSLLNCSHMFYNCSSLLEIPTSVQIPSDIQTLESFCNGCASLTSIPESIWPANFNIKYDINIVSAFCNCTFASGFAPYYKLWQAEAIKWDPINSTNLPYTFKNCSNLSNYNTIPKNWGGIGKKYNNLDLLVDVISR